LEIGRVILHESLIGCDRGLDAALRHIRYGMLFEGELEFDTKFIISTIGGSLASFKSLDPGLLKSLSPREERVHFQGGLSEGVLLKESLLPVHICSPSAL
jgi:hypothetical protein